MGKTVVTYPKLLDETDFYMALDMSLLIDEIKVTRGKNFKCIELIKSTSYYTSMLCSRYRGKTIWQRVVFFVVDLSNSLIEEGDFLLSRAWDIVVTLTCWFRAVTHFYVYVSVFFIVFTNMTVSVALFSDEFSLGAEQLEHERKTNAVPFTARKELTVRKVASTTTTTMSSNSQ